MDVRDVVLNELERIAGTDQVRKDLNIPLYDEGLLDSLGTIELMVMLGRQLNITISPASFEREQWATPQKIIDYIGGKVKSA